MLKMMKSVLLVSVCLSLIAVPSLANGIGSAEKSQPFIEGQMIISINESGLSTMNMNDQDDNKVEKIETLGLDVISSLTDFPNEMGIMSENDAEFKKNVIQTMGHVYLAKFNKNNYANIQAAQNDIKKKLFEKGLNVKSVEPNYIVRASGISTKQAAHPDQVWQYDMIQSTQAWQLAGDTSDVKVAILDTGIDHNHPSLKNFVNQSLGKNFTTDDAKDTMDRQGHGSHVAGTIASYGPVAGVMKSATLIPVKVLGDNGSGSTYGVEQGILYAAKINADVINMSLGGGGYAKSMEDACQAAMNAGTIVVAASGNESQSSIGYPAKYKNVISVGAVDENEVRGSFSNYGEGLTIMAPGVDVYSTIPNGGYDYFSGTSMASPHIAGVVGLLKGINKDFTQAQIIQFLTSTAYEPDEYEEIEYGAGIADAYAACQAAQKARK